MTFPDVTYQNCLPKFRPLAAVGAALPSTLSEPSFAKLSAMHSNLARPGSLTGAEFMEAYNAIAFSNVLGLIMNTHVSVTWSTVGVVAVDAVASATDMLSSALETLCVNNGVPSAWISVIENGRVRGLHLHLLASFPMGVRDGLKAWIEDRVREISGVNPLICTASETVCVKTNSDRNINIQWALHRYLMKSLDPDAAFDEGNNAPTIARVFGISLKEQGPVLRQRLRIANLLSAEARNDRGFRSLMDEGCRDYGQLYSEIYWHDRNGFCADTLTKWNHVR